MITATFQTWRGGQTLSVGPRADFVVDGGQLFAGGKPVALYQSGTWEIENRGCYVRFTFDNAVRMELRDPRSHNHLSLGIVEVRVIDGAIYTGPDLELLMLRFSELTESWYCYEDSRHYRIVHFQPSHSGIVSPSEPRNG